MKKLKLAVDDLQVESFHSVDTPALEGTVQGNDATAFDCQPTINPYDRNCASSIDICGPTRQRECISNTAVPCYCE